MRIFVRGSLKSAKFCTNLGVFAPRRANRQRFAVGQSAAALTALHAALAGEFVQNSVQKFSKKLLQRVGAQALYGCRTKGMNKLRIVVYLQQTTHIQRKKYSKRIIHGFYILCGMTLLSCSSQKHKEANLLFENWYIVKPRGENATTVAYGSITNQSAKESLLQSIDFSCAERSELHETREENGHVSMQRLTSQKIATNEKIIFEPAGKHVMLQKINLKNRENCEGVFYFAHTTVHFNIPIKERKL
ncbi:MAG: hypothetical protein LDLANPLL_01702 [Turneriella sp.]|nr:hypothetical protein [Turneriella sp.]